jgi:hypothetical protein
MDPTLQGGHLPAYDRLKLARDAYGAYESGDRRVIEELLSGDFTDLDQLLRPSPRTGG